MIDWHYPRKELAEHVLSGMKKNLLDRVTIFAPRKKGKTQFITHDIIPLCIENGILPVYVDFWLNEDDPAHCFIQGVDKAIAAYTDIFTRLKDKSRKLSSIEITSLFAKAKAEHKQSDDVYRAFDRLNAIDMPVLLLLDEVQHLATRKEFSGFTRSLRSFMVNRADFKIKGIFTGSNRQGLQRLFKETKAAFFESSQSLPFHELSDDFVRFQLENYTKASGGNTLDEEEAIELFHKLERSPAKFTELVQNMLHNGITDFTAAESKFADSLQAIDYSVSDQPLSSLGEIDLAILYLVALGQRDQFYTGETFNKIRALNLVGESVKLNKGSVSNAIKRLKLSYLYNPQRGKYELESPEMRTRILDYVAEKEKER